MKRLSLLIALLGIIFLSLYILFSKPIQINNKDDLSHLLDNQKVIIKSRVVSADQDTIKLENKIPLLCKDCNLKNIQGKSITVIGLLDNYQYPKINVLSIEVKNIKN